MGSVSSPCLGVVLAAGLRLALAQSAAFHYDFKQEGACPPSQHCTTSGWSPTSTEVPCAVNLQRWRRAEISLCR